MDRNYQRQSGPGIASLILNLLTLGVLRMPLCAGGAMTVVFINPATIERISPLLPIKLVVPPTLMPTLGFPTSTNTPEIYLPPTWTPTPSRTPRVIATEVPPPTETPTPTEVPLGEAPTPSPTNRPFGVQPGNPVAAENSVNELACDYLGIGGQVFDLTGSPVVNLGLHVPGNRDRQAIDLHSLTGTSGVPSIGPGAYLINLVDHPIASTGSMQIVLTDTSGTPLSAAPGFDTSGECEFNFVLF